MTIASRKNWPLYHLDINSEFLNGTLEETISITQPPGFKVKGKYKMVYKFHKSLYGFKQASRDSIKIVYQFFNLSRIQKVHT